MVTNKQNRKKKKNRKSKISEIHIIIKISANAVYSNMCLTEKREYPSS